MGKLNIRLPDKMEAAVRAQAADQKTTISNVIRNALSMLFSGELEAPSRDALELEIDALRTDLQAEFADHANAITSLIQSIGDYQTALSNNLNQYNKNALWGSCLTEAFLNNYDKEYFNETRAAAQELFKQYTTPRTPSTPINNPPSAPLNLQRSDKQC